MIAPELLSASPWWHLEAACQPSRHGGIPITDLMYPRGDADYEGIAAAKAICAVCTVRSLCLDGALARNEKDGVWGGLTEDERRRYRRRLRRHQVAAPTSRPLETGSAVRIVIEPSGQLSAFE